MVKFQCGKQTDCGNAIKLANAVKFQMRGKRQIFNSVEYSETQREFLFWGKRNMDAK